MHKSKCIFASAGRRSRSGRSYLSSPSSSQTKSARAKAHWRVAFSRVTAPTRCSHSEKVVFAPHVASTTSARCIQLARAVTLRHFAWPRRRFFFCPPCIRCEYIKRYGASRMQPSRLATMDSTATE
eukprot:916990-Pleurochrysis_carterae.AAC.2